jgi:aminoglycoside phosphotransferase (APT) family kinase protein
MLAIVQALVPGGRLTRMERLRGGIGARMHSLTIEAPEGERQRFVLRRLTRTRGHHGDARRLFDTLALLESLGILAPRPVLLDAEGRFFGTPSLVMTRLPGKPLVRPRDVKRYVGGLAESLAQIHRVKAKDHDLGHLGTFLRDGMREEIARGVPDPLKRDPLAAGIHARLADAFEGVKWLEPTLVHDDYFPGNVVWYRGKVAGVVDWSTAEIGDPRADVSQCRIDLAMMYGPQAAGAFLGAYKEAADGDLPDVWYWDLFRGLRALAGYERWLAGYHDLGLTELTPPILRRRLTGFLQDAVAVADRL